MRQIDWELNDGFPFDQGTMKFLQDESYDRTMALITYWQNSIGASHFIITGMVHNTSNNTVSPGWCWMNAKLLYYPGGAYPGDGCAVRPLLQSTEIEFEDGIERPALKYWIATINLGGSGEGFFYQGARRVPPIKEISWDNLTGIPSGLVIDNNYVHTDNNFTDVLLEKLNGIEAGAEKNVQADWAQPDQNHDSYIRNKPADLMLPVVRGTILVGDIGNGIRPLTVTGDLTSAEVLQSVSTTDERIVVHFPEQGSYVRIVNLIATGNWNASNDSVMTLGEANGNNFEIYLKGEPSAVQNMKIEITLLK